MNARQVASGSSARKHRLAAVANRVSGRLSEHGRGCIYFAECYFDRGRFAKRYALIRTEIRGIAARARALQARIPAPHELILWLVSPRWVSSLQMVAHVAAFIEIGVERDIPLSRLANHKGYGDIARWQCDVTQAICKPIKWTPKPETLLWNNKIIPALALTDDYPVLADALEEAGETDAYVLNYLRTTKLRVKGDHVIDKILGRQ